MSTLNNFVTSICIVLVIINAKSLGKSIHRDEICGGFDGRRLYLDLGEHGTLFASNHIEKREIQSNDTEYRLCTLEIVTCLSCVVSVQFSLVNLPYTCNGEASFSACKCNYVSIFEPLYEDVSTKRFCGHFIDANNVTLTYKSITRSMTIRFSHKRAYAQAFALKYFSEKNRHFIDGYPCEEQHPPEKYDIVSPYFPKNYPRDLSVEYVINCKRVKICRIRLTFTDFQISRSSLMENGKRIFVTTGSLFRPPILISTGHSIVIRFYANGGTNIGFKISYNFMLGEDNKTMFTDTNCGGLVDNLGGSIIMSDMVEDDIKAFNCFWIIKPSQLYLHQKSHIFVKIIDFKDFEHNTELKIREGLTSNGALLVNMNGSFKQKSKDYVVPNNEGFYISLDGIFNKETIFEMVYSSFSYKDCTSGSDFLCQNQRCIPINLECDGFNHCGDNSDELEICVQEPGKLSQHAPNFYFPKGDRDFDLKTATIVFIISSFALICFIISLIILIYRINVRGSHTRHLQTHLQSINDFLDENCSRIEEEIIIPDNPPDYDAPPNYSDVIKVVLVSEDKRIKVLKKAPKRKRDRKSISSYRLESDNDTSSVSTIDSTSNLIPTPISQRCSAHKTDAKGPHHDLDLVVDLEYCEACISAQAEESKKVEKLDTSTLSKWMKRSSSLSFNSNLLPIKEAVGLFSYLHTPKVYCLSDSDISCVRSSDDFISEKQLKIVRSRSIECIYKL